MTESTLNATTSTQIKGLNYELSEVRCQSTRISQAFAYAHWLHQKQVRKGNPPKTESTGEETTDHSELIPSNLESAHTPGIPYLTHLVDVFSLLIQAHASEDQLIAGLLHDAFEDQPVGLDGSDTKALVAQEFGDEVVKLINAATDGDEHTVRNKDTWLYRKWAHLSEQSELAQSHPDLLLVPLADKVANATSIHFDLHLHGDQVWSRFSASRPQVLWYYRTNLKNFTTAFGSEHLLVKRLAKVLDDISVGLPQSEISWEPTEAEIEESRVKAQSPATTPNR